MRKILPLVLLVGAFSGCAFDSSVRSPEPEPTISPETVLVQPAPTPPTPTAPTSPADPSTPPPSRYYLDDGPPESHGINIASIPDAVPQEEQILLVRNQPYRAFGKVYRPFTRPRPHRETGSASWYGRRYHGKPTASGEIYDMFKMTAAHPILPIPSYARVTRADDGRSVVVRVNDRGPFLRGRVIDLSYVAAVKLGMTQTGSASVVVESVLITPPEDLPVDENSKEPVFFIQVGAFTRHVGAGKMMAELQSAAPKDIRDRAMIIYDKHADLHRVGIGKYVSPDAARKHQRILCSIGICGFVAPLP